MDDNFTNFPEIIVQNFIRFLKKYPNFYIFQRDKNFLPMYNQKRGLFLLATSFKNFLQLKNIKGSCQIVNVMRWIFIII